MAQEHYDPWSNTRTKSGLEADLVIFAVQKCIRRAEEETALHMAYEPYIASTFYEEKMWSRLLVISVRDVGFRDTRAPVLVRTMYDLHKECPYMGEDGPIFSMHAIRYMCRCQKERSTNHIRSVIMKEFGAEYVLEVPEYVIDMHTVEGRAMGRSVSYFLDETSKAQPLWGEYDDSYRLRFYKMCRRGVGQRKKGK